MKQIDVWLDLFSKYWKKYQIENLMTLFTDDVEYWETPFRKIKNKILLEKQWQWIKNQHDIKIDCVLFSEVNSNYTIIWDLEYLDENNTKKNFRGVYLMRLNFEWKCNYFFHCGEKKL